MQKHCSYSDNELSGYGDNRPPGTFHAFEFQIFRPHERVSPHKAPDALDKVLDGFEGKLTSSKWAKLAKCSHLILWIGAFWSKI